LNGRTRPRILGAARPRYNRSMRKERGFEKQVPACTDTIGKGSIVRIMGHLPKREARLRWVDRMHASARISLQ
jgi:hypothetical protein